MYSMKALVLILTVIWNLSLMCDAAGECTVGDVDAKYKGVTKGQTVVNNEKVTYQCAEGYTTGTGSGDSTCTDGTLSTPTLECKGCPAPDLDSKMERTPTTANGAIVDDTKKLAYNCKSGYTASTTNEELTCNTNNWSPAAPTLTCTVPEGACKVGTVDAKYKGVTAGQIVPTGQKVTYQCADDYTKGTGSGESTCTTGTLSGIDLQCKGCKVPTLNDKMEWKTANTNVGDIKADGTKLIYNCKSDTSNTEEVTCNTNSWSELALTCGASKTVTGLLLLIMTLAMMVFYL